MQFVDRGTLWSNTAFSGSASEFFALDTIVPSPGRDSATIIFLATAAGTLKVRLTFDLVTNAVLVEQSVIAGTLYRIVLADGPPGGEIALSFTPGLNPGVLHARVECGGPVDCPEE